MKRTHYTMAETCAVLGIDANTLRVWMERAKIEAEALETDKRVKRLLVAQVKKLAKDHAVSIEEEPEVMPGIRHKPATATLLAKLAELEDRIVAMESRVRYYDALEESRTRRYETALKPRQTFQEGQEAVSEDEGYSAPSRPRKAPPRPSIDVNWTLPNGHESFSDFFDRHHLSTTTAHRDHEKKNFTLHHWPNGIGPSHIKWTLDQDECLAVLTYYQRDGYRRWHECTVEDHPDCPCHESSKA